LWHIASIPRGQTYGGNQGYSGRDMLASSFWPETLSGLCLNLKRAA
jgi:hypothetical protein